MKGIVISRSAKLTIRLSSGARVRVSRQKDLRLGDAVYVCYDYTRMVVRELWTEEEYRADDGSFGPELEPGADPPDMRDMTVEAEGGPVVSL